MAEITKTTSEPAPDYVWISLAALGLAAYFVGLTIPFVGPDEPRYAQVAREMYERADWITPTLGGYPWFEKPPLLYWFEIASYSIFGVSEFAARLGPALCGLGTVACLWILGRFTFSDPISKTEGQRPKTDLSNYLTLIAASTLGIVVFSHGASFDIVVTFTITASLTAFFIFDRTGSTMPLVAFYTFVGLSLLAKGLIGIVFPLAIVSFYYVLSRRMPSRKFLLSVVWGTLLACAIAAIWYVPMYVRHGWLFVDEFLIQHHFARFTSNKYQHPQPFYFFLWVLPLMLLPWTPFFVAAIWRFVKNLFYRRDTEPQSETQRAEATMIPHSAFRTPHLKSLALFAVSWLLVPLVFFSFSGSKLPGYVLPAVPAATVVTAIYVSKLAERSRLWLYATIGLSSAVFVLVITASLTVVPRFADAESTKGLILAAAERGYGSRPVYGLHTISYNAEFYAANRLQREPSGGQERQYGPAEVAAEMHRAGVQQALVLVPLEYATQLRSAQMLRAEFIRDNGELAIYAVSLP